MATELEKLTSTLTDLNSMLAAVVAQRNSVIDKMMTLLRDQRRDQPSMSPLDLGTGPRRLGRRPEIGPRAVNFLRGSEGHVLDDIAEAVYGISTAHTRGKCCCLLRVLRLKGLVRKEGHLYYSTEQVKPTEDAVAS